jgi:transposase
MCTRKIVGYSYGMNMTDDLTVQALGNAYNNQGRPEGVIVHSDRGSQYTSLDYQQKLEALGLIPSFSDKGSPLDNAPMESFHSLLKKEEIYLNNYLDFEHAKLKIFDYIEGFYNRNRIHSSIDFLTPIQFENLLLNR